MTGTTTLITATIVVPDTASRTIRYIVGLTPSTEYIVVTVAAILFGYAIVRFVGDLITAGKRIFRW